MNHAVLLKLPMKDFPACTEIVTMKFVGAADVIWPVVNPVS